MSHFFRLQGACRAFLEKSGWTYAESSKLKSAQEGAYKLNGQITVLGLLKRARDLIDAGQHASILEAISALKCEVSGRKRDLVYFAVLETAGEASGEAGMSALSSASREVTMALLDATIKRMTLKLH